ncbi:hypothetical protein LGM35_14610 [Burkholderia cenocepacia]|uniref:hypothetical protein n=1 Tax=Burkholderia cenocepacia TaxID=95486 RepID=UPI001CF3910B|nr:hypothetical protein [Burkholderia cenocepacia]MCA7923715.1 hypothetical protein [Burkholderia cenocepacia]
MRIEKPRQDLSDAQDYLEEMRHADSFHKFERSWLNLLTSLSRAWHRTNACIAPYESVKSHETVRLAKKLIGEGGDELLVYLRMARNASEHGLEDITRQEPWSLFVDASGVRNSLLAQFMADKTEYVTLEKPNGRRAYFRPSRAVPVAIKIKQKGAATVKEYLPPTKHLGAEIDGSSAMELGRLGISYYKKTIEEILGLLDKDTGGN